MYHFIMVFKKHNHSLIEVELKLKKCFKTLYTFTAENDQINVGYLVPFAVMTSCTSRSCGTLKGGRCRFR